MHAQLEDLYSLKLPLGRNLAGAVWQAETLQGGKPAAVAVLDLEDLNDPDLRKRTATRFRRDMGLLRRVNHPHVVRVFHLGRTRAGRPFAAMEHVEGENLQDWLESTHGGAERVRVASALLDGLEAAHRAGVAHGDLEPGNILMTPDGMPKLIGFGLNRTLARQSHPEWREESGLAKTIAFRAPEEVNGMGGHSADIYATGILLHLICSGELPSYGGSTLRESAPRLPAGLVAVIERALVEDPLERHPNMAAMRRAWLDAATVAREAIQSAIHGFRAESDRPMRPLSAPPAVGVALAPEEREDEDEDMEAGRPSLMPVGIALLDDAEDDAEQGSADDLASLPPEQVNVLRTPLPPIENRELGERFSDPPPDPGMRISLSDALDGDPPPDPEMRISLSDAMELSGAMEIGTPVPAKSDPRPAPRRPNPSLAQPAPLGAPPAESGGGSKAWMGVVGIAAVVGLVVWFTRQGPEETGERESIEAAAQTQTAEAGSEAAETEGEIPDEAPVETEVPAEEPTVVALRLHGLPEGARASVDGENVTIEGDSIAFPGDGNEHTIVVEAAGYETWERSLATATPLDLLVVSEAIAPPPTTPMESPMVASPMQTAMQTTMQTAMQTAMQTPAPTQTLMRATMTQATMTMAPTMDGASMRPGLARDPGF